MPWIAIFILALAPLAAGAEEEKDWAKLYPGGVDPNGFKELSAGKTLTPEIQGGFPNAKSAASYGTRGGWDVSRKFKVGDSINMEFHIGVKEAPGLKLSTKAAPAPVPVLYLLKDGKEFKVEKFTLGAC